MSNVINERTMFRITPWVNNGIETYAVEMSKPFLKFWVSWMRINSGPLSHCVNVIEYQKEQLDEPK